MALDRFITLSEAAQRMRTSVKETRSMIKSGKIKGGLLSDGAMVVNEDTLPKRQEKRKEDLFEYKKHANLKGMGISINEASRNFGIPSGTITRWMQSGIIKKLGNDGYRTLIDKADIAYCAEIYRHQGGQGKRLFNKDGTPYKTKNGSS